MKLLTLIENDGLTTRINVPVDGIAYEMVRFFNEAISINVLIENTEHHTEINSIEERTRGDYIMKEWQTFGLKPFLVVA